MDTTIATFLHVRARVRRARGGAWHTGWVTHLEPGAARFRLGVSAPVERGEALVAECYGDGTLVRFVGKVEAHAGHEVAIAILGRMVFEPSRESVRLWVEDVEGALQGGPRRADLIVMDASPKSLGGLSDGAFDPGSIVDLTLRTPVGAIGVQAGVVNCRAEPFREGRFRVGLQVVGGSRLDLGLWGRMVRERAQG